MRAARGQQFPARTFRLPKDEGPVSDRDRQCTMKRIIIAHRAAFFCREFSRCGDVLSLKHRQAAMLEQRGGPAGRDDASGGQAAWRNTRPDFIVENRPGGEGAVAMATLHSKPADGYTILSTTSSMSFSMATKDNQLTPDEFTVLPALQSEPSAIAVRADSRFKTMKEFIDSSGIIPIKYRSAAFRRPASINMFSIVCSRGAFKSIWVPFKGGQMRPSRCWVVILTSPS